MSSALFDIAGRVALVTGGVNGMGRMIAEGLLRAGARVYVTSRKAEDVATAQAQLSMLGDAVALVADLSTPEGATTLAAELRGREPALHLLVNNAGRTWGAPLEQFPDKAWPGVMAVNVQGPFTLIRELLPLLEAAGDREDPARIINIGSLAGAAVERISAYSYAASKAAVHHLSKVLADELAPRGITVNVLVPGYFPTQMTAHIRGDDAAMDALIGRVPMARLGHADDIVGACIFLASRAGRYVTGSELFVDGGMCGCR